VIGCVIYLLGGALQTGAQNLNFLWAGRWLAGLGVGFLVMIIPLYQAEIAHPSIRGTITALQQFMLGIGAFVAGWVSYGTYVGIKHSTAQWRIPLGLQMIPAVVLGALIFLFPESPRVSVSFSQVKLYTNCTSVAHRSRTAGRRPRNSGSTPL
jgi:MFS family permease